MALGTPKSVTVVGRGFGTPQERIAHLLLDGAVAVIAPDDGIRQGEVFDERLELAPIPLRDRAPEEGGELRRLANRAIRVEESIAERI